MVLKNGDCGRKPRVCGGIKLFSGRKPESWNGGANFGRIFEKK